MSGRVPRKSIHVCLGGDTIETLVRIAIRQNRYHGDLIRQAMAMYVAHHATTHTVPYQDMKIDYGDPARMIRLTVPPELLEDIDLLASYLGRTRTAVIYMAVHTMLRDNTISKRFAYR